MVNRIRIGIVLALALCLTLMVIYPGAAQRVGMLRAPTILNGDFEGTFITYDNGQVAQYWQAYDLGSAGGHPQYLRSTLYRIDGQASQMFWKDHGTYHSGIMQTVSLSSSPSAVHSQAGRRITAHVWMYSIYAGPGSTVQDNKIMKRVGMDPTGGTNPSSSAIVWTPYHGQDRTWVQINCLVDTTSSQITLFIEADNPVLGGQDQVYVDSVTLSEEGAPTSTATPQRTATPTRTASPTATPPIAVVRNVAVGHQPKGIAVMPNLNRFLVANNGSDSVTALEGFLDWRTSQFPSGGQRPGSIAVDPDRCIAYIANSGSSSVAVYNVCTSTPLLLNTVLLGEGKLPSSIAVLTTTNKVFVANAAQNTVSVISGETLTVGPSITVGPNPVQVAANPRTNQIYVTSRGYPGENDGSVAIIDGATSTLIKTIDFSLGSATSAPEPNGVAVNTLTNRVYVACASGNLVVIDGNTNLVLHTAEAPSNSGLGLAAVNPASGNLFVTNAAGNTVFVYDTIADQWSTPVTIGTGLFGGIAVNPLTYYVMVSNTGLDTISIIRDSGIYRPYRVWLPISLKTVRR